jgi:hypothetical protein
VRYRLRSKLLQGKGLVRQKSISLGLNFCFFCFKTKEVASAAMSAKAIGNEMIGKKAINNSMTI